MIQALHAILGSQQENNRSTKVTMLYGSKVADDILGHELLHKWAKEYPNQLQVIDVLSDEPAGSEWKGARGYIDKAMVETYFPKPSGSKFLIFVCGPPPMYNALCGPREEKEVKGLLGDMGYKPEQVFKF
jgi:cytochrome-b5 reductase